MTQDTGYERVAHLYDLFDNKPNIDFFHHYASQAEQVLDVGAGTGRIAVPLARRGAKLVCVEPSPAMRQEFKRKLAQHPDVAARIQLIAADARSFDAGRTFPMAFLSGVFDHFLDDTQRRAALTNIARHLVPSGLLVLDVFLGLMVDSSLSPAGTVDVAHSEIRRFVGGTILPDNRKETLLVFEVYRHGQLVERIEERSLVGITDREGVHRVLAQSGFEVRQEWGSYQFASYQPGAELLIVEAAKAS